MTYKTYAKRELEGYITHYKKFNDIPAELFDYMPENLEREDEDENRVWGTYN